MNNSRIIKILSLLLLFAMAGTTLAAYTTQAYDHMENPAFLSLETGKWDRKYFELGWSLQAGAGNSYVTYDDIFTEVLVLDLNKIAADLKGKKLGINMNVSSELHMVMSVMNISIGGYSSVQGLMKTEVPGELFNILADGINLENDAYSGSGDVYGRVFGNVGMYAGYRYKDWQISGKMGYFLPLIYTDSDSKYTYSLSADADGNITAQLNGNFSVLSPVNLENLNSGESEAASDYMKYIGFNMDLGLVRMRNDRALYGFSITGITLAPANMNYRSEVNFTGYATVDSIAANIDADELFDSDFTEPEITTVEESNEVNMPLRLGGFYNYSLLGLVDLIGSGGLTYDQKVLLDANVTAVGSFFPANMFYIGLGYDRVLWESTLGLKLNARAMEFGLDVGFANPDLRHLFSTSGAGVRTYLAFGW